MLGWTACEFAQKWTTRIYVQLVISTSSYWLSPTDFLLCIERYILFVTHHCFQFRVVIVVPRSPTLRIVLLLHCHTSLDIS